MIPQIIQAQKITWLACLVGPESRPGLNVWTCEDWRHINPWRKRNECHWISGRAAPIGSSGETKTSTLQKGRCPRSREHITTGLTSCNVSSSCRLQFQRVIRFTNGSTIHPIIPDPSVEQIFRDFGLVLIDHMPCTAHTGVHQPASLDVLSYNVTVVGEVRRLGGNKGGLLGISNVVGNKLDSKMWAAQICVSL